MNDGRVASTENGRARGERIGPYQGWIAEDCRDAVALRAWMEGMAGHVVSPAACVLTAGRNRVVRFLSPLGGAGPDLVVKAFAPSRLSARLRGGKALRTWRAALFLRAHGVGTPPPLACLERWNGSRLAESYYVSVFRDGMTSFMAELARLFREDPECARFMTLLQTVADAIRRMHDAGFLHNDLGNQNILLRRDGRDRWRDVTFVDLNRARMRLRPLTARERARDLSRINLPSDLRRVFLEMVAAPREPGRALLRWERFYRARYAWHCATRVWRHPLRERRLRAEPNPHGYPPERDLWIWDERSGQAIGVFRSRDKRRLYPVSRHLKQVTATLHALPAVRRAYRELTAASFQTPVAMRHRVAVAVSAREDRLAREREWLARVGRPPVHVRFLRHEDPAVWRHAIGAVRAWHSEGVPVSIALVQDRMAVRRPDVWRAFVRTVLDGVADCVEWAEVGHAINRVKWGFWSFDEYGRFLGATRDAAADFPGLCLTGPAGIDFEYPFVTAALRAMPEGLHFGALSHHLYVDRRGAPENRQGAHGLVEKLALGRAVARGAGGCGDRLIVSEVNWPLLGTGVYSPVGSPYESPGARRNDPSVSEEVYADYMVRYLLLALCSGMAERVVWWQLAAHGYGLIDDADDRCWRARPAFDALATCLRLLGQMTFVERLGLDAVNSRRAYLLRFRGASGGDVFAGWSAAGNVEAPNPAPGGKVLSLLGRPLPTGETVTLGSAPIYCLR